VKDDDDIIDSGELLGLTQDRLFSRQEHRNQWFAALLECKKYVLYTYDGVAGEYYFYTFMMPDFPMVVAAYSPAGPDYYNVLYYSIDWYAVEQIDLPINPSPSAALREYFLQAYGFNTHQKESTFGYPFVTAYGAPFLNLSPQQLYEHVKEYYVSFDKPKYVGGVSSYQAAYEKHSSAWSALSCP